jgi:hypothetical protein
MFKEQLGNIQADFRQQSSSVLSSALLTEIQIFTLPVDEFLYMDHCGIFFTFITKHIKNSTITFTYYIINPIKMQISFKQGLKKYFFYATLNGSMLPESRKGRFCTLVNMRLNI